MQFPIDLEVCVNDHLTLLAEQGCDVSALRARFEALSREVPEAQRKQSAAWAATESDVVDLDAKWQASDPDDLEAIFAARPRERVDCYAKLPGRQAIARRLTGGWLGRVAGLALGMPVECLGAQRDSRGKLRELLTATGDYPLRDYISVQTMTDYWRSTGIWTGSGPFPHQSALRGHIQQGPCDDDINYTILGLRIVRECGRNFTPDQVLDKWLWNLPYYMTFTAERAAVRNRTLGMAYPQTARFLNPHRELIGAQIRADFYGYVSPGNPQEAARMAWSDAAATHVGNGIYGAMWVAAAIAAAYVDRDPAAVIRRGLEQIPEDSRLARELRRTIEVASANGDDYEATLDDIQARTGQYNTIHAINNSCVVAAGLIHGRGDFGRAICVAVMGGLDTDCNGATVGSMAGIMAGAAGIPAQWKAPLRNTVCSMVKDYGQTRIPELVRQTMELIDGSATDKG